MKCAYKRELMRMRVEQYNEEERDAVLHVQCLVLRWLADKQGWGHKRLQRFANQALFGLSENFQRMRSEDEGEFDVRTVPFLLKNLEINMEAVLPDFKQIESDYQIAKPKCRDRDKRMYRYMRLQDREAAVKIYWYRYMILLSMEYGFGKKRLDLLYRNTREKYRLVWSYYLNATGSSTMTETRSKSRECSSTSMKNTERQKNDRTGTDRVRQGAGPGDVQGCEI